VKAVVKEEDGLGWEVFENQGTDLQNILRFIIKLL